MLPPIEHWHKLLLGKTLVKDDYSPRLAGFAARPLQAQRSWLLKIPIVIRLLILQDVLGPPDTTHWPMNDIKAHLDEYIRLMCLKNRVAIIFTCRQLFQEWAPLAYKFSTFMRKDLPFDSRLFRSGQSLSQIQVERLRGSSQEVYLDNMLPSRK